MTLEKHAGQREESLIGKGKGDIESIGIRVLIE